VSVKKPDQIFDDQPFAMRSRTPFTLECCDCSLVHDVVLTKRKGPYVGVVMRRNLQATKAARGRK
jgi:hypothetical protein